MPIRTDIHTQELIAQFRAQRETKARQPQTATSSTSADSVAIHSNVKLQATVRASGGTDQVDISFSGSMTVQAAHEVLNDSIVDEINRAFEEAGLDIKIESLESQGQSQTPEATARRIVDFATAFQDAFNENHASEAPEARIEGFLTLIRDAIARGFEETREFLNGITKLSETVDENISKTFEVTNALLDEFHQAQLDGLTASAGDSEGDDETATTEVSTGAEGDTELTEGLV